MALELIIEKDGKVFPSDRSQIDLDEEIVYTLGRRNSVDRTRPITSDNDPYYDVPVGSCNASKAEKTGRITVIEYPKKEGAVRASRNHGILQHISGSWVYNDTSTASTS